MRCGIAHVFFFLCVCELNMHTSVCVCTCVYVNMLTCVCAVAVAEGDLFWDFERQVELESFDVHTLYGVIDGQTSSLTDRMDESANRLLCLYRKIAIHTQMIRNLLSNKATVCSESRPSSREIRYQRCPFGAVRCVVLR